MSLARFALVALLVATAAPARAQTSYPGTRVTHDFSGYAGFGLSPIATGGALDSDAWFVESSLGSCDLGETCPNEPPSDVPFGPFYGGTSAGGVSAVSLYAFDLGGTSGTALGVQISTPFVLTAAYRNDSGAPIGALVIAYTFAERNDVAGQVGVSVAIDPDGPGPVAPIPLDTLADRSADAAALPAAFVARAHMEVADLSASPVAVGGRFDVIFTIAHHAGIAGTPDEIAIDDVIVAPAPRVGSCGDGTLQRGEQCDPGPLGADCCSPSCTFVARGTACGGAPTSVCDAQDTCDGLARCLPAYASPSTVCRAVAGSCDVAELCTGVSPTCPVDQLRTSTTTCRPAAGPCDVAERCTGSSAHCPSNRYVREGTSCSNGVICDGFEACRSGVCQPGTTPECDDGDACTADLCAEPGGCASTPVPGCCHSAADCSDGDPCTADTCTADGGTCGHSAITGCCTEAADCQDGNPCTANACDVASRSCTTMPVAGCCDAAADCDDGNPCTTDACDVATGACTSTDLAGCCVTDGDCDDGDACTIDACSGSACTSTPAADCADAGPIESDAGTTESDAGTTESDAGTTESDAAIELDAALDLDAAGAPDGGPGDAAMRDAAGGDAPGDDAGPSGASGGCSCRVGSGGGPAGLGALLLLALAIGARRRR